MRMWSYFLILHVCRIGHYGWHLEIKAQHFGFGQSEVWYATDDKVYKDAYLNRIINQIQNYNGDNWLYK